MIKAIAVGIKRNKKKFLLLCIFIYNLYIHYPNKNKKKESRLCSTNYNNK